MPRQDQIGLNVEKVLIEDCRKRVFLPVDDPLREPLEQFRQR